MTTSFDAAIIDLMEIGAAIHSLDEPTEKADTSSAQMWQTTFLKSEGKGSTDTRDTDTYSSLTISTCRHDGPEQSDTDSASDDPVIQKNDSPATDGTLYYESINDDHGRRIDNGMSKAELKRFKNDSNLTESETRLADYLYDNLKLFDQDSNNRLSRDEFLDAFDSALSEGGIGQMQYSGYQHGPYNATPRPDGGGSHHSPDSGSAVPNKPDVSHEDHSGNNHSGHGDGVPATSESFNAEVSRLLTLMDDADLKRDTYNPASVKLMAHMQELENLTGVDILNQFAAINDQVVAKEAKGTAHYAEDVEVLAREALVGWLEAAQNDPANAQAIMEHIASVFSYSTHTASAAKAGEHAHHMGNTAGYSLLHAFQTHRDGPIKQDILDIPRNFSPFTAEGVYQSVLNAGVDKMLDAAKQDGYFKAAHGTDPQNYKDNLPTHKDTQTMLNLSGYIS